LNKSQSMKDLDRKGNNQSGSLKNSEPEFLVAGRLRKSHGLNGEMWIEVLTDHPEFLIQGFPVFIGKNYDKHTISAFRMAGKLGLIQFDGFNNPESLRIFANAYLYFETKDLPALEDEEYYHHDLIGLEVKNEDGELLGTLTEIIVTGANDVYVISPIYGSKDLLIPAIKSVIKKIDIESKQIIISPQEWDI
jgi:16S rRNA processing protein RimM